MNIQKLGIIVLTVGIFLSTCTAASAQVGSAEGNLRAQLNRPVLKTMVGASNSAKLTPNAGNVAPGTRLMGAATMLSNAADKMSSLSARLQVRITQASTAGQNVVNLQALLSDMQAKITDAKKQSADMQAELTGITQTPQTRATMKDAISKLLTGIKDLRTAGQDARQVIQGLVILSGTTNGSGSPSAIMKDKTFISQPPSY